MAFQESQKIVMEKTRLFSCEFFSCPFVEQDKKMEFKFTLKKINVLVRLWWNWFFRKGLTKLQENRKISLSGIQLKMWLLCET